MGLDSKRVKAVQLNLEGLFKFLGGSADDRQKFWEKKKGITSVLEAKIINAHLDTIAAQAKAIQSSAKALNDTAQQIARRG